MTSLSTKRQIAYHSSLNSHHESANQINLNTDELESKMDTIISHTSNNTSSNHLTSTIVVGGTVTSSITNFSTSTDIHFCQVVGTTTNSDIDIQVLVSLDNITYYKLPQFNITTLGTLIYGSSDINFQYFKVRITNTHPTDSIDIDLITISKNK